MKKLLTSASIGWLALAASGAMAASDPLAPIGVGAPPPPPAPCPVTETLWGVQVTDQWRCFEKLGPATIDWMKAEGAHTRRVMDAIKPLGPLQARVSAFTGSFGFIGEYSTFGGREFYQDRPPGADQFNMVVRDRSGTRKIVDVAALMAENGGKPYAVNYFLPSPDGTKVAVGVSEGGSEMASLTVYDAATGARIAGPITRAQFGAQAWTDDSRDLFFNRLQELKPGMPGTDKYKDSAIYAWDLTSAPISLWGATTGHGPAIGHEEFPAIAINPGTPLAILLSINGVQREIKAWTAPVAEAADPRADWKPFIDRDDDVTGLDSRGDEVFLLSHKDAPTYKVLELKMGQPLSAAITLVPAQPGRVIEHVNAAKDALYVQVLEGSYSRLLRIPAGSRRIEEVPLPAKGHITAAFTDPRVAGIDISLQNWVNPPQEYRYNPADRRFTNLHLGVAGSIVPDRFEVRDLEARGHDGVMIPETLIEKKGAAPGPRTTVIEAYGSYGISNLADFSTRRAAMFREGINYAICHVRGGGELGHAWYMDGKGPNKHNTWQDLISCGEDLIARGVTTKAELFILGGSAGGITVGRAMTERPDLFAGAIDIVPAANSLRMEFSPNGPDNIPEFGSVTTKQGFEDLYADDSIQHVKPGVDYPAVLISTGLNDPRVAPWSPAKFAAALMASGSPNPVLLRVDTQAGHGIGQTRAQGDLLTSDWIAFCFWRSGRPEWRPDAH